MTIVTMWRVWGVAVCMWGAAAGRPQGQMPPDPPRGHFDHLEPVRVQPRDINVINEPTCDELKAMWRFSKRQARTPEIMNEISTYKDPFSYNEWSPYYSSSSSGYVSSSRSAGGGGSSGGNRFKSGSRNRPVFGRVIHKAPLSAAVSYTTHGPRGYDQVAKLYGALQGDTVARRPNVLRLAGGGVPIQTGRFQHLKELIRTERARELQQQRAAEELAARAAALKEIAAGQRYRDDYHGQKHREYLRAPWGGPQDEYNMADDPSYYHTAARDRYSGESPQQHGNHDGIIAYPDLLAPPVRRSPTILQTHHLQPEYFLAPLLNEEDAIYFKPFAFEHPFQRTDNGPGISFN